MRHVTFTHDMNTYGYKFTLITPQLHSNSYYDRSRRYGICLCAYMLLKCADD